MTTLSTFAALTLAALATACANPGTMNAASPDGGSVPMAMGATGTMAAPDTRMKAMQEMHQKMRNASTPAERQALMADHMKAMQGGMAMMKETHAMHGAGGMGGMGMKGAAGSEASMAGMADHMALMQTMMDMMADRMPPAPSAK